MTITQEDKKILYYLQYIGDRTTAELADELRIRESTLQSKIGRWQKERHVAHRVFINTFMMGATEVELLFTPSKATKGIQAELVKAVMKSSGVRWFYRTAGKYDYSVGIEALSMAQVTKHLEQLDSKTKGIFVNRETAVSTGYWWFGRKYLAPEGTKHSYCLTQLPSNHPKGVNPIDHQILRVLGQRGVMSYREIASATNIPQSTVGYRVNNLIKNEIITGKPYLISPSWLGMLVYRLQLRFTTFSAETHKALLKWCQQHPHVVSMMRLLGTWDYFVRCEVAQPQDITAMVDQLHDIFWPELHECSVVSVVQEIAFSYYPIETFSE